MSRFLPPGGPFPPQPQNGDFTDGPPDLLEQIGSAMKVRRAATEGRIPSPVSRAYLFYANLFLRSLGDADDRSDTDPDVTASKGRKELQNEARRTLRGLLATFALRDVLDLDIGFKSVRLSKKATDSINQVLVPALDATPGGQSLWNPVQFYTLRVNGTEEVLAGRSPLTGLYPSATPPSQLTGLYWYAQGDNGPQWYDPTSRTLDEKGEFMIADRTLHRVRQYMRAWLDDVLPTLTQNALQKPGIEMEQRDAQRFMEELQAWRDELGSVDVPAEVDVSSSPIATGGDTPLPFLSSTVQAPVHQIWGDLPMHKGRLIVTREEVRSETTRLYGRHFGSARFEDVLDRLPREGKNLGKQLGLGEDAIPVSYLYIDELFTSNLTLLTTYDADTEDRGGLSEEWTGLDVDFGGTTEYYLIPLDPKILEIMDPEELVRSLSAELAGDNQNYVVRLDFGGTTITKLYSTTGKGAHQVDALIDRDEFDLRLFPNYDLDAVRHLITGGSEQQSNPSHEDLVDDTYHARLRLSPSWDFRRTDPFRVDGNQVRTSIQDDAVEIGDESERSGTAKSTGKAVFYTISETPDGFHVPKRGFCLLDLRDPRTSGVTTTDWSVGIDFGTSNTCVAYRDANDEAADPEILQLPVMTTTLLGKPNYNARFGHVFEGASAVLDFFYNYTGDDDDLMSQPYFPTQLLTQQQTVESDDVFDIKNGLIYFDNIGLAEPALLSLIEGFPQIQEEVPQRFSLKQDIKWEKTDWLRVFMHHLRKQIVLTAAARNARVKDLHFSYPKSFDFQFRNRFEGDLDMVWGEATDESLTLASESEAARDHVVGGFNQHIIFDIGGGTTDIIGFHEKEPIFQTSFKLAAGQVNDYVLDAPTFRNKFIEAIEQRAKKKVIEGFKDTSVGGGSEVIEKFQKNASNTKEKGVVLQLWLGLLQRITDVDDSNDAKLLIRILNYLRTEADRQDAIQGFFLSNTLLLGGLAYYTGQLLDQAADGGFGNEAFSLSQVTLTLTGNGSRLYNMLTNAEYPFADVMKQLFRAGAGKKEEDLNVEFDGLFTHNDEPAPKVTVALGLLQNTRQGELRDVPVANVAAEEGFPTPDGETNFNTSLVDFYQSVVKKETTFDPPREVPPNLEGFLDALGDAMPFGKHGQFKVIPAAHRDWTEDLKEEVYTRAVPFIKNRGHDNAILAEDIEGVAEEDRPALEPLFIAQIVGMMEAIRQEYAG